MVGVRALLGDVAGLDLFGDDLAHHRGGGSGLFLELLDGEGALGDSRTDLRNFPVRGADPHRFDGDNNGIGCETRNR